MSEITIQELMQIVRDSAGADEHAVASGDVLERTFEELGYDSLALMETTSRIERTYQLKLSDDEWQSVVGVAQSTPRDLLRLVNHRLTATA